MTRKILSRCARIGNKILHYPIGQRGLVILALCMQPVITGHHNAA